MITGLTQAEVAAKQARGEDNSAEIEGGRSYLDIARANLFTFCMVEYQ